MTGQTWVVAGLGNPGPKYAATRHNAGARAVELLAADLGEKLRRPGKRLFSATVPGSVAETLHEGARLVLMRPETFMNESGRALSAVLRRFKSLPASLIVVHDDIDLAEAALRVKLGGSSGGNRGIRSIENALGTGEFYRVRIGVGRPPKPGPDPADYVLAPMTAQSARLLSDAERKAGEAALSLISRGLDKTANEFNQRQP